MSGFKHVIPFFMVDDTQSVVDEGLSVCMKQHEDEIHSVIRELRNTLVGPKTFHL